MRRKRLRKGVDSTGSPQILLLQVFLLMATLLILSVQANAAPVDVNIYGGDFLIDDGDDYGIVNVWNDANVTMTGGNVERLECYDYSHLILKNGSISSWLHGNNNSIIEMEGGYSDHVVLGDSSIMHLSGGEWPAPTYITAFDDTVLHIYGYGFYYAGQYLNGYWVDDTSFNIWLRGTETVSHVVLHEIPEPATFFFLGVGYFLIKKRS